MSDYSGSDAGSDRNDEGILLDEVYVTRMEKQEDCTRRWRLQWERSIGRGYVDPRTGAVVIPLLMLETNEHADEPDFLLVSREFKDLIEQGVLFWPGKGFHGKKCMIIESKWFASDVKGEILQYVHDHEMQYCPYQLVCDDWIYSWGPWPYTTKTWNHDPLSWRWKGGHQSTRIGSTDQSG